MEGQVDDRFIFVFILSKQQILLSQCERHLFTRKLLEKLR